MAVVSDIIKAGVAGSIPAASSSNDGYLYFETDTLILKRSNGSAWVQVSAAALAFIKADGTVAFTGDQSMGSHKLTNVTDPASAQDAATKAYVDSIAINLGKRARVRAATTANITIATALNNGDTLDTLVTLATGDLVLVKNQTAAEENGIYVVGVSPARFSEFDTYDEHPGSLIAVQEGTANADTAWLCTSNVGGTINSTAINFSALSAGGAGSDTTAIHDDVSGEINALTEKVTPANDDIVIIEDSAASYVKKKVKMANLGGGGATPPTQVDATDIANCVNWIDLHQETGAEGDAIGTLSDWSVSNNDATQGTGANKPTLRLNVANGKKGAYFDGSNDYLTYGTNIDLATNHTILIVAAPLYKNAYTPLLQYKQQGIYQYINATFNWGLYRSGDGYCAPVEGGRPQIFGLWGSSNSAYDFIHNYLKRAGTNTNAFTAATTSYIGTDALSTGTQVHSGYIFEIRIYDAKIAEADLYASIDWLLYKWTGFIRQ